MTPTRAGQALLDCFEHIVVVNLAHRKDRLREISAQLARLGLSFEHPAVLRFDACRFETADGFPTAGTRGCFHSHLGVWREAMERGDRATLLLEDDLDFDDAIEQRLPSALAALASKDWSIFYGAVLEWNPAMPPGADISEAGPDEPIMGGHFLAMRGETIARAVRYLEAIPARPAGSPDGGPMHVDGAYSWFRRANPELQTCVATPDLGHQRSSRTDIHALGLKDRVPILRELTALLRRAARKR